MSLLPPDASFEEHVQATFTLLRGRGLALSAHDVELVTRWAEASVPVEVVVRGLKRAAEAALFDAPADGEPRLRSLAACRRHVEAEILKYQRASVGRHAPAAAEPGPDAELPDAELPVHLHRHQRLLAAVRALARKHPALQPACARLQLALTPTPRDYLASVRQEELFHAVLLRAQPHATRHAWLQEAHALDAASTPSSAAARRELRRFHRAAVVRRHLALPPLW